MKLHKICAYGLAMFLMSPTAFCAIVSDGDWDFDTLGTAAWGSADNEGSSSTSEADGDDFLAWTLGEGWETLTNTVSGTDCGWSRRHDTWAYANVRTKSGQTATAYAAVDVAVEVPDEDPTGDSVEALVEESGTLNQLWEDFDKTFGGPIFVNSPGDLLDEGEGCSASYTVLTLVGVAAGETDKAHAHADGTANVDLWIW